MKKFLKNGIALFLTFAIAGGAVYAKLPNAYWKTYNSYLAAKEKGKTAERIKVEYRVSEKWIASPNTPPYKVTITPEQLALGNEIIIKMIVDNNVVMTKNIKV